MSGRLAAKFAPAFSRDLKKKATRRDWNLAALEAVVDLILENSVESVEILKRRHNMHSFQAGGKEAMSVMLPMPGTGFSSGA